MNQIQCRMLKEKAQSVTGVFKGEEALLCASHQHTLMCSVSSSIVYCLIVVWCFCFLFSSIYGSSSLLKFVITHREESMCTFDDKRTRSDSLNSPSKQAFRMKMSNPKVLLSTVAKKFKERSKRRQSATRDEEEPRQMRRVSTHVSAMQVHPMGSPGVVKSSWFEKSEDKQPELSIPLNPSIPSRFTSKLSPYPNRPSKQQDSPLPIRAGSLTGSLPGSPVTKRMQHKGVVIPQRFLGSSSSGSSSPTVASKAMSPVPSRFFQK